MKLHALTAHFGSLRNVLASLALLFVVVLGAPEGWLKWPLTAVFALLSLQLLAALVVHPAFRRKLPLLVAHLALLALVVLAGVGRLASLDGRFELTQGVAFDGRLMDQQAGPLHVAGLDRLAFEHDGFEIDYAPGLRRGVTRNPVRWRDEAGRARSAVIGDHRPLVIYGYRIYTSSNKGFAPLLRWQPAQGEAVLGAVHLPSYPMHALRQSREWQLPDGRAVWVMLQFDETLIDPAAAARFRMPREHRLVVRIGQARHELAAGEALQIEGGTLVYDRLSSWMGYRIAYDPTLPWLLASALLAALALGWHYVLAFRAQRAGAPVEVRPQGRIGMEAADG